MEYVKADISMVGDVAAMELALFPDADPEGIERHVREAIPSGKEAFFVCYDGGKPVGHVDVALRTDYVEGVDSSPVGYLEAIYVDPAYRGKGVARELARLAEAWAAERGCVEMASDAELDNDASLAFHARIGYREVSRNAHFHKRIGTAAPGQEGEETVR